MRIEAYSWIIELLFYFVFVVLISGFAFALMGGFKDSIGKKDEKENGNGRP